MTIEATAIPTAVVADAAAEARWQAWRAVGARDDRRRAKLAARVALVTAIALIAWLAVQLIAS